MHESRCGMNPGSSQAMEKGCICSAKDNRYGRGHHHNKEGKPGFVICKGCPVHDPDNKEGGYHDEDNG